MAEEGKNVFMKKSWKTCFHVFFGIAIPLVLRKTDQESFNLLVITSHTKKPKSNYKRKSGEG
jgi:hypothetical protein